MGQGTEGIAWLCACEASEIESGAFYLVAHTAGLTPADSPHAPCGRRSAPRSLACHCPLLPAVAAPLLAPLRLARLARLAPSLCSAPLLALTRPTFEPSRGKDRSPAPKHLAGPFFTEGSYTKNSKEEVAKMMQALSEAVESTREGGVGVEATPDTAGAIASPPRS